MTKNNYDDQSPSWSPDGKKILFVSKRPSGEKWIVNDEIFTMNLDGSSQSNITNDVGDDRNPAWSPDGEHIAFVSNRENNGKFDLYTVHPDGSALLKLTENITDDYYNERFYYSWSPDGKKIAISTHNDEVFIIDSNGKNKIVLPEKYYASTLSWSPDGNYIVLGGATSGERKILICDSGGVSCEAKANGFSPVWLGSSASTSMEATAIQTTPTFQASVSDSGEQKVTSVSTPEKSVLLFSQDFENGKIENWENRSETPLSILEEDGNAYAHFSGSGSTGYPGIWMTGMPSTWKDYAFESRVRGYKDNVILCFYENDGKFYQAGLDLPGKSIYFADYIYSRSESFQTVASEEYPSEAQKWYTVRVEMVAGKFKLFIDDELVLSADRDTIPYGGIGFITKANGEFDIDDVKVWKK